MLKQSDIRPSWSLWNSPLFLVPPNHGQSRPFIDFRKVSELTEDGRHPLPLLNDLLMSLGHGNKFFSSLGLLSGCWQVPVAPDSRKITAFSTPNAHIGWLLKPFGLMSALITFQTMINTFSAMLINDVYAYLDGLLVFGKGAKSHVASLETILLKLRGEAVVRTNLLNRSS